MLIATILYHPKAFGFVQNGVSVFFRSLCWEAKVGQVSVAYDLYARIRQAGANNAV